LELSAVAARSALKSKSKSQVAIATVQKGVTESSLSVASGTVTPTLQECQTQQGQVQQLSQDGQNQVLVESASITPETPLMLGEERQASSYVFQYHIY